MLKLLSSQQLKELDQYTIKHEPIASIDLMERAGQAFVDWFVQHYFSVKKIGIICGTGNNGGDGLCIARKLHELQYHVTVWIVRDKKTESENFTINRLRLANEVIVIERTKPSKELFQEYELLIDSLFGIGLSRPIEGIFKQVISTLNQTHAVRVAVDVPSGLCIDSHTHGAVVHAHHTVSFQLPKLAFLLPENQLYVGQWHCVDIGLSKKYLHSIVATHFYITPQSIKEIIRPRSKFAHKGNFGHALLIAGSHGKMGACVLSAKAAMRTGVGVLTVHVPAVGYGIVQTTVPEAMALEDPAANYFSSPPDELNYSSIGIGPGLGFAPKTASAFAKILKKYKKPMVIDADALTLFAKKPELLKLISVDSIFTPHVKEFERIVGSWKDDFERLTWQRNFSIKHKIIVVFKGAYTTISLPDGNLFFNSTGNPGMATAGSGDVLTGIITSLLAQGYQSRAAALLGVYLHGLSGDLAAHDIGMESLIAGDIIDYLPDAFKKINEQT